MKTLGYVGIGKMGSNMVARLKSKGYKVIAHNRSPQPLYDLADQGFDVAFTLEELCEKLGRTKVIWLMISNDAVDVVLQKLKPLLNKGDTIIDGGNSFYKDSIRRAQELETIGVNFLDAGVSGGPGGALTGASIMVGGRPEVFEQFEKLFSDLAVADGYAYLGKSGAGHFAKMIHNGIEYGMMQALAEGFDLLRHSQFSYDLTEVLKVYANGSVIESRLVDWLASAYEKYGQNLEVVSGSAEQSGEGMWSVETAKELNIDAKVIKDAVDARKKSKKTPNYQGKIITALRGEFGNHSIN